MKKRLFGIICLCSLVSIVLCACSEKQNLVDMGTMVNEEYMAIIWEDRTYVPFCPVSKNDCGAQIGYVDGGSYQVSSLRSLDYLKFYWQSFLKIPLDKRNI